MSGIRRFACTQCGACCNRSPEVELSEAAALADAFVFRLMFRLYTLPRAFDRSRSDAPKIFYQKKRLLTVHAARVSPRKIMRDGKPVDHVDYLMISALALDTTPGACAALVANRCSIYERRPLTCRTVPFHYSRADGLAQRDFDDFVSTPGYRCDLSESAPIFLRSGSIVDADTLQARSEALSVGQSDRPLKEAIVRRMKRSDDSSLPSLHDIEANAALGAMTTSMRIGWQVAADSGLLDQAELARLIGAQLATIDRALVNGGSAERQTLQEMSLEYRQALEGEPIS